MPSRYLRRRLYGECRDLRERLVAYLAAGAGGPGLSQAGAIELAQRLLDRALFMGFTGDGSGLPEGVQLLDGAGERIALPDRLAAGLVRLGEWGSRGDVPLSVLGHIFERSVGDLERLSAASRGEAAPRVTRRKRHGIVYTPDGIARFLVALTVGRTLEERRARLRAAGASEGAFWRGYVAALRDLEVLDPACGSGAFLLAAFELLAAEYRQAVARLQALGEAVDLDLCEETLAGNLYGVDRNAESVEIARLSLWHMAGRSERGLERLEATIRAGDSLVDDARFTDRPFDWGRAFPDVLAGGGFDVVIGNPPYVRMELIKRLKPYLQRNYAVAGDRTDLYAYFFERGVALLKEGGRLGYISSSTFFRTGSGERLRAFLGGDAAIEAVVDFGDLQIFEGITTYPAILTLRKGKQDGGQDGGRLRFLRIGKDLPCDLGAEFAAHAKPMPRARLGAGAWQFEGEELARLRDKIAGGRRTLGEVYGAPLYGIKTGCNDAFIVDQGTRDGLVARDPRSAGLLRPVLRGENIQRWRTEPQGLYLIDIPKGKVDIEDYPAIRDWLLPFKPRLEARATRQAWFELQQAQLAYQADFLAGGIALPDLSQGPKFAPLPPGLLVDCTAFFISAGPDLLAFLNSRLAWFVLHALSNPLRGGIWRLRLKAQYVAQLPLPAIGDRDRSALGKLARTCAGKPAQRCRRGAGARAMSAEIEMAEREADAVVYRLFDLTPGEIALLEAAIAGQY
jgi:Eco57I restriction-modification methylase